MQRRCPICKKKVEEGVVKTCVDAQVWVIKIIKSKHPQWVASDGSCPKCLEYYSVLGEKTKV